MTPPDPDLADSYLSTFPKLKGPFRLYLVADDRPRQKRSAPPFYVQSHHSEAYSFREGGDDQDRLEILETRQPDETYSFRCWISSQSRWTQKNYAPYFYAATAARDIQGAQILELGSNHWPVMPLGVFPHNATAEFHTLDCHYPGLWLMEKLIQARQPTWAPRIHRYLCDFTEPMPLPDSSIDLAVSVAAFGTFNFQAEEAWETYLELDRVLKPGACFYCDGLDLESRPAWLTWAVLQKFRIRKDWNSGHYRDLCLEKRN